MTTTDTQFQAEPAVYNETRALLDFFFLRKYIFFKKGTSARQVQLLIIKPYFQNMRIN